MTLMIGPSITRGYYKNPEANAVALNGEWLHTGDIAIIDEGCHLTYISDGRN
jgi:long-subunit acyl-CoA synthetase (AMP-forming)